MPEAVLETKKCSKCGEKKPPSEFYKDRRERDGLGFSCKLCTRLAKQAWRKTNPKRAAATERQRRTRDYKKVYCRERTREAIRNGVLVRPSACEGCKSGGKIEAHHEDYGKPLDVRWLCAKCHPEAHCVLGDKEEGQ